MLSNHANAVSSRSNHSVALNQQVYRITDLFWDGTYRSLGTFLRALRRLSVQIEPHMQRYVSHGLASAKTPDKTTARSVKHIHLHLAFPAAFENFDILNPFPTNSADIDALYFQYFAGIDQVDYDAPDFQRTELTPLRQLDGIAELQLSYPGLPIEKMYTISGFALDTLDLKLGQFILDRISDPGMIREIQDALQQCLGTDIINHLSALYTEFAPLEANYVAMVRMKIDALKRMPFSDHSVISFNKLLENFLLLNNEIPTTGALSAHRLSDIDLAQHLVQMVTLSCSRVIEESLSNKLAIEGVAAHDLAGNVRAIRLVLEKNDMHQEQVDAMKSMENPGRGIVAANKPDPPKNVRNTNDKLPPTPCKWCTLDGRPNQMHWNKDCPWRNGRANLAFCQPDPASSPQDPWPMPCSPMHTLGEPYSPDYGNSDDEAVQSEYTDFLNSYEDPGSVSNNVGRANIAMAANDFADPPYVSTPYDPEYMPQSEYEYPPYYPEYCESQQPVSQAIPAELVYTAVPAARYDLSEVGEGPYHLLPLDPSTLHPPGRDGGPYKMVPVSTYEYCHPQSEEELLAVQALLEGMRDSKRRRVDVPIVQGEALSVDVMSPEK